MLSGKQVVSRRRFWKRTCQRSTVSTIIRTTLLWCLSKKEESKKDRKIKEDKSKAKKSHRTTVSIKTHLPIGRAHPIAIIHSTEKFRCMTIIKTHRHTAVHSNWN